MMTIIDILIYVAFAFFASNLAKKSEDYIEDNDIATSQWDKYLTQFVIFFTIISGIRWNVGSDSITYATIFAKGMTFDSSEKLWSLLVQTVHSLGLHWAIGLGICGFLQIFFVTKALQPYRWLLVFVPFVFFGSIHWLNWTGAVRQMIVGCAFFWATRFIYQKDWIKYIAFVIIGSLIHKSTLILLPLIFMPKDLSLENKKTLLLSVLGICVVLGQLAAFNGMAGYAQSIAMATEYDAYGDAMYKMLSSGYDNEALKFGPMMLTYLLIPVFIICFGTELKERYSDKIPYFNLWFNFAYAYSCLYFLVCNLGHIFIRPVLYLSVFQLVMASLLLCHLCTEYKKYAYRQTITYLFCIIIALNTVWDVFKASGQPFESTTYKVFIFNNTQRSLFNL